jgi:uncharacterized protein DUF4062
VTSTWRVFLSSTATDLTAYRQAATRAINGVEHFELEQMESWGAVSASAVSQCDDKLRSCQVYVAILGPRYGTLIPRASMPADLAHLRDRISYTELEYTRARMWGIPRLIYLLTDDASRTMPANEGPEGRRGHERFRDRVHGDYVTYDNVRNPPQLARQLGQDLSHWAREYSVGSGLVDRVRDYRETRRRLLEQKSTIVCGPRGIGKSAVINALVGQPARAGARVDPLMTAEFGDRVVRVALPVNDAENWAGDMLRLAAEQLNRLAGHPWSVDEAEEHLQDPAAALRVLGGGAPTLFVVENLDLAVPAGSPVARERALQRLAEGPATLAEVGTLLMEAHDHDVATVVQQAMISQGLVADNPVITIGDLPAEDAVALLVRDAPSIRYCLEDARALVRAIGGNPQALRLVGGSAVRAATIDETHEVLRSLQRQPERAPLEPYRDVMATVIGRLPEADQRLLADLAVLPCKPHSFHFDAVVALAIDHPTLARDLADQLRGAEQEAIEDRETRYYASIQELLEEWAAAGEDAEAAQRREIVGQVRGLNQAMARLCAAYLVEEIPPTTPDGPQTWMIHSLVAELALHGILPGAEGDQAKQARYKRLEGLLRDRVTGRADSGYAAWYRFEDTGWQDEALTWLYVLPNVDGESARRAVAGMYLDCLWWWWGAYLPFPFTTRLLRLARRNQLVTSAWRGQDRFLDLLEGIERDYPKGWHQGRAEYAHRWENVGRHVRGLIRELDLAGVPAGTDADSQEAQHVLSVLLLLRAESQRFRAPHAGPTARAGLEEAALADYAAAIDLVDAGGDAWNAAYIRVEWADALAAMGQVEDATAKADDASARAAALRAANPQDPDFELLANVARVRADLAWMRQRPEDAFEAHGRALHYAYAFMIHPWRDVPGRPQPDAYARKFYREQRERCQARLRGLAGQQGTDASSMAAIVAGRFLLTGPPEPSFTAQDPAAWLESLLPTAPDDPGHPHDLQGTPFRAHALGVLRHSQQRGDVIVVPEPESTDEEYPGDDYATNAEEEY